METKIVRKLKCRFSGDKKYLPDGIPENKWIPVIGYEIRERHQASRNNANRIVNDIFYLVLDDKGKIIPLASFNCQTIVDDSELQVMVSMVKGIATLVETLKAH